MLPVRKLLADPTIDLLDGTKYLIQLECGELSRARGGPRCMTMPLSRAAL
ncbi:MAG: arginine deiminase [Acidobacteria bacterium ADurb.Bin340]|nr:MAG: arginine deiminase [Acidobacteria bacterium ADurb.Bin340]